MHKQRKGTPFFHLNRKPQYQEEEKKKKKNSPHLHTVIWIEREHLKAQKEKKLLSISPQQER